MKVKKFSAHDNQEALMKVKNELGADAIILYQRKVKQKGILGFFKKPLIEVVAAKEDTPVEKTNIHDNKYKSPMEILQDKVIHNKEIKADDQNIAEEVSEIKNMLNTVMNTMTEQRLPEQIKSLNNPELTQLFNSLKKQDIDKKLIHEILQQYVLVGDKRVENKNNIEVIRDVVENVIKKYIIPHEHEEHKKIMFFIGPTGVGKTTTIAKLAAHYTLTEGKTVGLISADTYRIAAIEQLKIYSDILSLPLEVIYKTNEIHFAMEKLKNQDLIMIDTAGRSHKNNEQVMELKKLLNEVNEKEVYLVMSCTSKNSDIKEIINTYNFLNEYNIIFTKIDEATSYGTILNIAKETKKPISYITTGQNVPDDIQKIDSQKILDLLIKGDVV